MNSFLRIALLLYFGSHIPITLFIDAQGLLYDYYPSQLRAINNWYISTYGDHLMDQRPYWFQSFILAELCFQLPFFFVAFYALYSKKNWIRIPGIVYGVHVATTVWPIIPELLLAPNNPIGNKLWLLAFYSPYFLMPAILAIYMCLNETPWPVTDKRKRRD